MVQDGMINELDAIAQTGFVQHKMETGDKKFKMCLIFCD